jgi:Family of unknown function (DUF6090)
MSWLRLMEESIPENEPKTEVTGADLTPPTVHRKKQGVAGLVKEMWPAYLIEIIVIILGISITLAMESWRDETKEGRMEQVYLKNLVSDVDIDLLNLDGVIEKTKKLLGHGNELIISGTKKANTLDYSRVNGDIRSIISRPKFISNDASFSDLKSSGNLHLIKDVQLKNLLFAYYNQAQIIRENQESEQLATITLSGNYFLKHFSLNDSVVQDPLSDRVPVDDLIQSVEFQNNVLLRVSNRNELLEAYIRMSSLGSKLRTALSGKIE